MSGWEIVIRKRTSGRCKRIHLSGGVVFLLTLILVGVGSGFVYWSLQVRQAMRAQKETAELQQALAIKDSQLRYFAHRMLQVREELSGIQRLSEEVERRLGRVEKPAEGGLGGPIKRTLGRDIRRLAYLNSESALLDQMWTEMEELEEEVKLERGISLTMIRFLQSHSALIRSIPNLRPIKGGFISSPFGRRKDPFTGALKMHMGMDFAHSSRVPVYATAEGIVTFAGWSDSYGRLVTIYHGFGISTRYAHLSRIEVKEGQWVDKGQEIGRLGSSGRSTHRHLHYEVRIDGRPVNPYYFLPEKKEEIS